jgi:sialidase-1
MDGYPSIRIPALLSTQRGMLLALAEGRAAPTDQAANQIILKRSTDCGRTWGPLQVVAREGKNSLNNPCVVQEASSGRILVMIQSYPAGGKEFNGKLQPGVAGSAIVRNYLITSDDDGATWTSPRDVTVTTKAADAITVASGPGVGIQLRHGAHRDRLIMPFNQRVGRFWDDRTVYSDDGGVSWKLGELVPEARATNSKGQVTSLLNEVQMVELQEGAVRLNSRQADGQPFRKTAVSRDGGQTWSQAEQALQLADPACMGSILRYSFAANATKSVILYSGPNSTKRENGTVYVSHDEGQTWPIKRVLCEGCFAYSCLTRLKDGSIGILYESGKKNPYETVTFARFSLDWLENQYAATRF